MDNPKTPEVMIGFNIVRQSDAELVARLLTQCQGLGGVRVESIPDMGFAVHAGGDLPPIRVEQLQAYAQGAIDCLRAAAGELEQKPAPPL